MRNDIDRWVKLPLYPGLYGNSNTTSRSDCVAQTVAFVSWCILTFSRFFIYYFFMSSIKFQNFFCFCAVCCLKKQKSIHVATVAKLANCARLCTHPLSIKLLNYRGQSRSPLYWLCWPGERLCRDTIGGLPSILWAYHNICSNQSSTSSNQSHTLENISKAWK